MEINLDQPENKSIWYDIVFYAVVVILAGTIFSYGAFELKIYLLNKKISQEDDKIAIYGTQEQKDFEKEVFDYNKKINDFSLILNNHKITSNVFSFIESRTLPSVWFSNFSMSESANEIRLTGEADTMETLSRQFQIFEQNKDYVKNITVVNSQVSSTGRILFVLNLSLDKKIFEYRNEASVAPLLAPD